MSRMRRRWMRWPLALAAVAVLAGCVSIPTSGGVTTVQVEAEDLDPLLSLPASPAQDASPEEIVAGFLRAGRGPQENYRVAREYLTDDFRSVWVPGARTLISSTPIAPEQLADNTWRVTVSTSASVDGLGRYQPAPGESYDLEFGLVQNDEGQWRISSAPDGTVVDASRFSSIFAPYRLYFFDPSFDFLVPDLRWYRAGTAVANRVVDGLLAGPSDRLGEDVVFSAFPAGADRLGDVVIADGSAVVPMNTDVSAGTNTTHRRMQQQLLATLRSVASVREVTITVSDFEVQVPDGGASPDSTYLVGNDPIGEVDGRIGVLTVDGLTPLAGIGTAADALDAVGGSIVSHDRDRLAVLTASGSVVLVRPSGDPLVLDNRDGLVVPSLDPLGYTWSVPRTAPGGLIAVGPDGVTHQVPGMPAGGEVISIDVARDGARLLIALDTSSGPRLLVAGIQRDDDLVPVQLVSPVDLPVVGDGIIDAAWADGVTVVALTTGALNSVDAYDIGGQRSSLGALNGGVQIVGGNGPDGTRVLDEEGNVLRPGGGVSWQDTGLDASFLVAQQ